MPPQEREISIQATWKDAIEAYREECEFTDEILRCTSVDDVLHVLQSAMEDFKAFRDDDSGWAGVRTILKRLVSVTLLLNDTAAEAASSAGIPGGKAILVGFGLLLTATKGLSERYDALVELLSDLAGFLDRLAIRLEAGTELRPASKRNTQDVLVHLLHVLNLATKLLKKNRFVHWVQILSGNKDMKDALAELDRLTTVETRMTIAENYAASQHILNEVRGLHTEHEDHLRKLEHIETQISALVDSDIYSWLAPPDPSENHHRIVNTRHAGTGAWLSKNPTYLAWRDDDASTLWLHGQSGSGKSVICSSIVDTLKTGSTNIVAYYYFDFRDTSRQSSYGLLCSLVLQLSIASRDCAQLVREWHTSRVEYGKPSVTVLLDKLRDLLQALTCRVYFIIDGVDECPLDQRRTDVLPCLEKLLSLGFSHVHVVLSSRPEIDIRLVIDHAGVGALDLLREKPHLQDIESYIMHTLTSDPAFGRWPKHLVDLTGATLRDKADGMFRWVSLQLESLRTCLPKYVQAALHSLPKNLGDTYTRVLDAIDRRCIADVLRILQCLAFAALPLSVNELAEMFAVDFDCGEGDFAVLRSEYRVREPLLEILKLCSGLVSTDSSNDPFGSGQPEARLAPIYFSHASVQDYILSSDAPDRYRIDATMAHTTLAQISLATLLSLEGYSPLNDHASRYWPTYSTYPTVSTRIQSLLNSFLIPSRDLDGSTGLYTLEAFYNWSSLARVYRVLGAEFRVWTAPQRGRLLAEITEHPLSCAVAFHLPTQAKSLLELPLFSQDYVLRALHVAVISGSNDMIQLLSSSSLMRDINAPLRTLHTPPWGRIPSERKPPHGKDDSPRTLLQVACDRSQYCQSAPVAISQIRILSLLLDNGARPNAVLGCPRTALYYLIQGWSPALRVSCSFVEADIAAVFPLLIQHGLDVNATGSVGRTCLHECAMLDEEIMVLADRGSQHTEHHEMVSDAIAESNLFTFRNYNPFDESEASAATAVEDADMAPAFATVPTSPSRSPWNLYDCSTSRLLLEHGACVGMQDRDGQTALHLAAQHSDSILLRLLLEHGGAAHVNTANAHGQVALHLAASSVYGNTASKIGLLVQHGADVEAPDKRGITPLMRACSAANLFHREVWRAFGSAERIGNEAAGFQALLHYGAEVNARDTIGRSALHILAGLPVAELSVHPIATLGVELLDRGLEVDIVDVSGRTALEELCTQIHDAAAVLLGGIADLSSVADEEGAAEDGSVSSLPELIELQKISKLSRYREVQALFCVCEDLVLHITRDMRTW
ncbi:unnamed protein product [Peniophora sp. CBMAI 1063]|nr:unnamed protein product [Peniophora sp. CBMAI 1063]